MNIFECWWQSFDIGDIFWMLVYNLYVKTFNVEERVCWWRKGTNRHQQLQVVGNTFCLQHPSHNFEHKDFFATISLDSDSVHPNIQDLNGPKLG